MKVRKNRSRRKFLLEQKLLGLCLIAVSVFILFLSLNGTTAEDRDGTALLFTAIPGVFLLFSKRIWIF